MVASIVPGATYRWHRHLGGGWGLVDARIDASRNLDWYVSL